MTLSERCDGARISRRAVLDPVARAGTTLSGNATEVLY